MRTHQIALALVFIGATAVTTAQDKEPAPPAGCTYTAYHAFTECKAASKGGGNVWWIVTDGLYACQGGKAPGRQRVHEQETALACDGKNKVKAPQPQTHYTVGLAGGNCQAPAKDGEIFIQECIGNIWYNVKYLRYRCLDGSVRIDAPRYYSTGKPCGGDDSKPPELDPANPGTETAAPTASNTSLDLADPGSFPTAPIARQTDTQLMMIDQLDLNVPGTRAASADPLGMTFRGVLASAWRLLAGGRAPVAASDAGARGFWLDPIGSHVGGGLQGVTRASRVHAYLTSLGTSQGEAFDMVVVNDGTTPVRIGGDGVVVEPIKKGAEKTLRAEMQKVSTTRGASVVSSKANAYCLEFKLKPPDQGLMFHVADGEAQQKYAPAREILRASRRLQAANQLAPDSDPAEYFVSIRQWAIWVNEQRFTQPQYRGAFVERIKKDVAAMGKKWTKEIENGLTALTPHRWDEIVKILRAAGQPVPGA